MAKFNIDHKIVLDEILLENPLVRAGKMFGYPAYYVGKKLCICLYEEGVGMKVPEETAKKLLASDRNVVLFQPLGRKKMREWIQINLKKSRDYKKYQDVFDESIRFVLTKQEP